MSEGAIVAIVEMVVQGTIVLAFGLPLLAYLLRRRERKEKQEKASSADPQIETRLARMETALDSIAIELERISEGQRFTTKLMSEKQETRAALPQDRSPE